MSTRRSLLAYSSLINAISTIPNNEIWYTSTDGNVITPYATDIFGANIVSNTYSVKGVIEFDGDVTTIGDFAFLMRRSLTSITIPENVTFIGKQALAGCNSLTSITIPDSVTSIGLGAFTSSINLATVYCKPTTPPTGDAYMFDDIASNCKIYVPAASVDAYKSATYWSAYASAIVGYDFENGVVV